MTRPNFFCGIDAFNKLLSMEFNGEYKDIDLTMDFIELPFLFVLTSDETNWNFKAIKRGDIYQHNGEGVKEGELVVNKESGTGEAKVSQRLGENMSAFFEGCRRLGKYIQDNNLEEVYEGFDPEEKGILLYVDDDQLLYKVVVGKERPDMMVDSLFAGMTMGRPYMQDFMENSERDFMSLDEKIEAAENGDVSCMDALYMLYVNGDEVDQDPEKAVYWLRKMADAGESNGMFNLGLHYAKGFGVERDFTKAAYWMQKAADAGDSDAVHVIPMYQILAEKYDRAKAGDVEAMADVAKELMALGGSLDQAGTGKDYEECVEFATKAIEQNNADACWVLALCYEHGRGVKENKEKAVEYYKLGASRGNASCMQNLGVCYIRGIGVPQNQTRGFEWEIKSAELGNALAMKTVGQCYQFGNGCMGNMTTAIEWYEKSLAVEYDEELARKVEVFKSISVVDEGSDEDYGGYDPNSDRFEDSDPMPEFQIPLSYTKTGSRKERSNRIHIGDKVTFKFSIDGNRIEAHTSLGDVGDVSSETTMLKAFVEKGISYEAEISELVSYEQLENKRKNPTIVVRMRFSETCGEVCEKTGLKYITRGIFNYYEWDDDSDDSHSDYINARNNFITTGNPNVSSDDLAENVEDNESETEDNMSTNDEKKIIKYDSTKTLRIKPPVEEVKMSSKEATDKMKKIYEGYKHQSEVVEANFDDIAAQIEASASQEMNIFIDDVFGTVHNLVEASVITCVYLYENFQSFVEDLDRECRPLLSNSPSDEIVRDVYKLIAKLNDDSNIDNNYTLDFNHNGSEHVVTGNFEPRVANLEIEQFWKKIYESSPQFEIDKKAEEKRQKEIAEKKAKEKAKKQSFDSVFRARKNEFLKMVDEIKSAGKSEIEDEYNKEKARVEATIVSNNQTIKTSEAELAKLGFFAFGAKSELKNKISSCTDENMRLKNELEELKRIRVSKLNDLDERNQKEIDSKWKNFVKKNPLPDKATDQRIKILNAMMPDKWYTVSELNETANLGMSVQRISAYLNAMAQDGKYISRRDSNYKATFSIK